MLEAVFISDLHLCAGCEFLDRKFNYFIDSFSERMKSLYILGDFFHAYAGDDCMDEYQRHIASRLNELSNHCQIFIMGGNRDFLIGSDFAALAGAKLIAEPYTIVINHQKCLLVHGDGYCTLDKSHQRFRALTRNKFFKYLFLSMPKKWRQQMVHRVREKSANKTFKSKDIYDVSIETITKDFKKYKPDIIIHGHTHKPIDEQKAIWNNKRRMVLSDWDDIAHILCYDKSKGFYFYQISLTGDQ